MGLFSNNTGFDRVQMPGANGEVKSLTRKEFEGLPLDQRVRAILSGQLRFFRKDKEIPMREALDGK